MQMSKLMVMAVLAAGTVARAESTVPCDFVDDFCVAPPRALTRASAKSEPVAEARSFIPGNFVDDFGVEARGSQVIRVPAPAARSVIPCNFVDDFCVEAPGRSP